MPGVSKVLVFPCGSEIGLELHRSLRYSPHFELFGASSVPDHGQFVYRRHLRVPHMVDHPAFLSAFVDMLSMENIDFIFPAHDEALVRMSEWSAESRLPAVVLAPGRDTCRLCRSKGATYARFAELLPVPKRLDPRTLTAADFPVFLKPDAGQGSRGAMLAADRPAMEEKLRQSPGDLVLEYLPGEEYTVDCFTDRHNRLLFASGRVRRRVSNGISVNSCDADLPFFLDYASTINRELYMRGAWFFQLKMDAAGVPKLLEIAPRIGGTSGLQRVKGVNLPLLTLYDRLDLDVEVLDTAIRNAEIDRALASSYHLNIEYDVAYLDLDDTVLIDGMVNTDAVKFIFQCRNRGVKVVLLTRHINDPAETLRRYRLDGVFDEVVWFKDYEGKSTAIDTSRAIFIDDSFLEREEVSESLGIPVFDPSSLEALLEP